MDGLNEEKRGGGRREKRLEVIEMVISGERWREEERMKRGWREERSEACDSSQRRERA